MRVVILHHAGTSSKAGLLPPLSHEIALHEHASLKVDATGTRVHFTGGEPTAEPCVGPKRIAGLSIVEPSRDGWCLR